MRPTPDSRCLYLAARAISPRALARAALDPSPTCSGTVGRTCLSGSGILVADGSGHQPLLAPNWTQPRHERHPHHRGAVAPGMQRVVKTPLASSYSHQAALDRNNFASQLLVFVCQPNFVQLDQASLHSTERKHRSTAGQMGADAISVDRRHAPKHAPDAQWHFSELAIESAGGADDRR